MKELIVFLFTIVLISLVIVVFIKIDDTSWEYFEACHIERSGSLDYCFIHWVTNEEQELVDYKECISQTDDLKWCFKWTNPEI